MYDRYNRKINYLRVSVTDRCNLRCTYCMPAEGVELMHHKDILRFDEIIEIIEYAVCQGVDKVRITGGEPLVRKGITDLIVMISKIKGIKDFGMTTNGVLLDKFAQPLADAGLHRVNISLDTLDADKYNKITRIGDITQVFKGINAAKKAGLTPIKINCVVSKSSNEPDAVEVAEDREDPTYEPWFNGGLIYSGPGNGSDGSGPSFTVSLDPDAASGSKHMWSVHT